MIIYNADTPQNCKICGFQIMHNKQGRFTSHLRSEHKLSLNEYLLRYFYKMDDLTCSNTLCKSKVKLRRGRPNKYCSRSCASKGKPIICLVCQKEFDPSNRKTKTCSKLCAKKNRSIQIKKWHESMGEEEKQKHFRNIITKTARTRKINNTPSWNSGKTNIYSQETINKIRNATLKQMENHTFKKTKIERIMEKFLTQKNIDFQYSFILENRQFDFLLKKQNIIIECDGDYWHSNPYFYPNPTEWQKERIKIDILKNNIAINNGYLILRFWEFDIINNFEDVKSIINDLLATTESETIDVNAKK